MPPEPDLKKFTCWQGARKPRVSSHIGPEITVKWRTKVGKIGFSCQNESNSYNIFNTMNSPDFPKFIGFKCW